MDQVTRQNAAMVEQSTAASHALATEATKLARLMGQVSIGGAAAPAARRPAPAPTVAKPLTGKACRSGAAAATQLAPQAQDDSWEEF
jgi:methyl-accepting chemotaxis protein